MAHLHSIYDTDPHFLIDPVTRAIKNESTRKTALVQGDHNSERFTFEMPRMVEGHDMSLSTRIEVHFINIASDKSGQSENVYIVDDMQISPNSEDESIIIFSWLLSGNATRYNGTLAFAIRFVCLTGETIEYAWNTAPYTILSITKGINNGEAVIEDNSDILAAWEQEIDELTRRVQHMEEYGCGDGANLACGEGENSVQQDGTTAISPNSVSLGSGTVAGGKGYKIVGIVFDNGEVRKQGDIYIPLGDVEGYELDTVEGLEVGQTYSVRLLTAAYDCGTITSISGNRIIVENAPQIKGFNSNPDDLENGFVANVLTIKGHPELGHIDVGFNAFSTGNGNYVSERNGFASGSGNHVLGCNGASFGRDNVAGYDALVWGRGNKALVDQSAVGGRFAKQSAHALLTLGNGTSDTNRSNAFEVLSDGNATFAGKVGVAPPTQVEHAINGTTLRRYLGSNGNKTASLVFSYYGGYANVGDNTAVDFSQEETIQIPSVVGGYPVYGLNTSAFNANLTVLKVIMRKGLSSVGIEAFNGCRNLSYLSLADTIQEICRHAFNNNTSLTQLSLPRDIIYIGRAAFNNAPIQNTIMIPQSCKYIGYMSSETNSEGGGKVFTTTEIPSIVFEGKPLRIHAEAFSGCSCDIYVPWSEGEVEGAPWGTTGTVHYNYNPVADPVEIVQRTGESRTAVMSQKAVSDIFDSLESNMENLDNQIYNLDDRIWNIEIGSGGSSGGWIGGYSEDASLVLVAITCTGGWQAQNVVIPQRQTDFGIEGRYVYFTAYHWGEHDDSGYASMDGIGGGYVYMMGETGDSEDLLPGGLINGTWTSFSATGRVVAYKL